MKTTMASTGFAAVLLCALAFAAGPLVAGEAVIDPESGLTNDPAASGQATFDVESPGQDVEAPGDEVQAPGDEVQAPNDEANDDPEAAIDND